MGPSGCGKTTTLRMIAGLEKPSAGEIRLRGRLMNDLSPWHRDTPMVWQTLALFPFLDVRRNVEFGLKMRGLDKAARRRKAMEWLQRLGIGDLAGRSIDQVSGGQRQRVALARALVVEPPVLLLDEPLSALDANLVVRMQAELTQLQKSLGITFIYVTHSQSEAFAMANRVVIMNEGRIVQVGAPREIYRAPASRFVAEFVGANNIMTGRVTTANADGVVAETAAGSFRAVTRPGQRLAPGEPVTLVVSADRVLLSEQAGAQENRLSGTLISEEFVGAVITLHLDIGNGAVFRIQKQQRELDSLDLTRGGVLHVGWNAADTYVLPQEKNP
jgi:spermidine/putrescine transport system ATP-binding protein